MMALFEKSKSLPLSEINELRQEGLTDEIIKAELSRKGYPKEMINQALMQAEASSSDASEEVYLGEEETPRASTSPEMGNMYERIEEITENMIDEKWDDLIAEVKKIIEWKEKIEENQSRISNDLAKLKEDFKSLHQGVLGKLEDYDKRMEDVGTELKAVGKVFKDVIPTFVDNVKELKEITKRTR